MIFGCATTLIQLWDFHSWGDSTHWDDTVRRGFRPWILLRALRLLAEIIAQKWNSIIWDIFWLASRLCMNDLLKSFLGPNPFFWLGLRLKEYRSNCRTSLHWGPPVSCRPLRLATQMEAVVQKMQAKYEELTAELSEATVKPDEIDRQPGFRYKRYVI